jgi:ABC-2 type transport system ATP-binding protein
MPQTHLRPAIEARGLRRCYGDVAALTGVDLSIEPHSITALLGPNGAGKTTFVNLVLGRGRPDAGTLRTLGATPGSAAARRGTGVMLQTAALVAQLTVREHLELNAGYYPAPVDIDLLLARLGLTGLAGRRYGALSGGQQRRAQLALALVGNPALLVLDEPTVALDGESRRAAWALIRERADSGAAVLLTTHLLDEAEALADRIVVLARGRLIADATPAEIRARVGVTAIRCETSLTPLELAALPGVIDAGREEGASVLRSRDTEGTLRCLLQRDLSVRRLQVTPASLEEALNTVLRQQEPA